MNDKTPKRKTNNNALEGYSPISLPVSPAISPQKSLTGTPRVVRDIVADLYNNIQRWNDLHITGANIVKQIASLKLNSSEKYPPELEDLTNQLYNLVEDLAPYTKCFQELRTQISATVKLQKDHLPLFISLSLKQIADLFNDITSAYQTEYNAKIQVLENIAHAKNKDEAMFLAACWTYQCCVTKATKLKLEALLIETGHRKFS